MHDWTLLSVVFEWSDRKVIVNFKSHRRVEILVAHSVVDLHVPQTNAWGPSVSVNEVRGPLVRSDSFQTVEIEMQSGDVLSITAKSFEMPDDAKR
jgi:hypothetical protein